jgi:hypothetical protein
MMMKGVTYSPDAIAGPMSGVCGARTLNTCLALVSAPLQGLASCLVRQPQGDALADIDRRVAAEERGRSQRRSTATRLVLNCRCPENGREDEFLSRRRYL